MVETIKKNINNKLISADIITCRGILTNT